MSLFNEEEELTKIALFEEDVPKKEDRIERMRRGLFDSPSTKSQKVNPQRETVSPYVMTRGKDLFGAAFEEKSVCSLSSKKMEPYQGNGTSNRRGTEASIEQSREATPSPRSHTELDNRERDIVRRTRSPFHDSRDFSDTASVASKKTVGSLYDVDKCQMSVVYRRFGPDSSVLEIDCEEPIPAIQSPDDVIIKVQASTVSVDDCLDRRGFSFDIFNPSSLPIIPGKDIVGHVLSCGENVVSVKRGDRVAALVRNGGNTRYIRVSSSRLVKVPGSVAPADAAAMVATYTAAYQALKSVSLATETVFSLEGKKVLIVGGMHATAQALVQMCLKARATVYATAPDHRHAYVRNVLGAVPLPENSRDWLPLVHHEMDLVFDGLCEDGLETPSKALNITGELVCFGHASMIKEKQMGFFGAPINAHFNRFWGQTMTKSKAVDVWDNFEKDPEIYKKNLKSLFHLLKWGKVKPHIARRVALVEVADSQAKLEEGEVRGIIVCLPWKRFGSKQ